MKHSLTNGDWCENIKRKLYLETSNPNRKYWHPKKNKKGVCAAGLKEHNIFCGLVSDLGQKEKSSIYLNKNVVPKNKKLRLRCYGSTTACQAVSVGSTPTSRSEGFKVYLVTVVA